MHIRHALAVGVLALVTSACASTGNVPRPFPMPGGTAHAAPRLTPPAPEEAAPPLVAPVPPVPPPPEVGPVVETAMALRGTPYRNGGTDPSGFDCSGFTQYVFAKNGLAIPRAVRDQYVYGLRVKDEDLEPGDLVFFSTTAPGATHVGIAIGSDRFVHAPSSTGVVRVERLTSSYWSPRYLGARRPGTDPCASGDARCSR